MTHIEEDYFTSCMGTLISSTTFTSFVSQAINNSRKFVTDLTITNAHATAGTLLKVISGGQTVASPFVPASQTVQLTFREPGLALSLNSGMEVQGVAVSSYLVQARGYTKNILS